MQRASGTSSFEGLLLDWVLTRPEPDPRPPVWSLDDEGVAVELARLERNRAKETAREAELILRLAELRPDTDDPARGARGARSGAWRRSGPEFPGVSEFFPDEVAHALNLGRGTAAFRARRAWTWRESVPATFAALRRGEIDERRAGVLADALQHTAPETARAVEAALLPEASALSLTRLGARALELLAELDAEAIDVRHEEAQRAADVRCHDAGDGMATLATDMSADEAAACYAMIDQLATMAKAEGDPRPIGEIRSAIHSMLVLRPADHDLPGVTVNLAVTASLEGLEGASAHGGDVNGLPITAAHLRELLRRLGALGLTTPEGGSLMFAITDPDGRLRATLTAAQLARRAAQGCVEHPLADCGCAVLDAPPATDGYAPTAAQQRFVRTRDRRCRMPNCGQRVGWADLDHVVAHARGGSTGCANLCCLCRSHHRLKTFARGWAFHMDADGVLHVTSPSGVTRTTRPPGLRPPDPEPPPDVPADDPPPF
ncbi:HNH endonuclease signature motif containing protein [Blastococcus litoris]|uniref:HNH endonuclease signature motif containing protein n=1 Tax=Blastococcus litoris TaxID=2171622 RepID=UPI000E30264F|nr:HNH endonuclease signature motif containing protein [Blastococcus litoris]